jgi:hypothetical protein
MKQSRLMSLLETSLSTAIGFAVALATQVLVFPLFGFHPALHENLLITLIFTAVSIARQYLVRRLFEGLHIRRPLSPFLQAVIAERFAHLDREGWSAEHDDAHRPRELAQAGAAYALHAGTESSTVPHEWPWSDGWWKPYGFRRDLVRAAALVIAEGDRFDRDRKLGRGR